jgi:hypothetical protein
MSKYRCVFRNCNTIDTPGAGVMPPACAAKGCAGKFEKMPGCKTFMQDALPPEPIFTVLKFSQITRITGGFPMPPAIRGACKRYPTRAVVQA